MATLPTTVNSTSAGFQPAFKHIGTSDRHACALASIAIIASVSFDDVRLQAENFGMPKTGPYYQWIDADFIAKLLAHFGWVATVWKECANVANLPDLCMALVDYDVDWEVGRFVVIHKAKSTHDAKIIQYAIDPAATELKQQIRTDLNVLKPAWYIGAHPMNKVTVKNGK